MPTAAAMSRVLVPSKPWRRKSRAAALTSCRRRLPSSRSSSLLRGRPRGRLAGAEQGACIAKTAALAAGWDVRCAGVQVNRFCASGLEAVNLAAQKVASGFEDLVVAGGVESMSRVPIGADGGPWAQDPATNMATD